jgi:thioredoxin-related protein
MRIALFVSAVVTLSANTAFAQVQQQSVHVAIGQQAAVGGERQPLFRHETFPEAWSAAQAKGRPVLLYVTSDNCIFCKKMLRQTLTHPQISQVIAEHAETFAFNASQSPELAQKLGVRGYPTTLVISTDRELLCQIEGFVEPQEFAERVWPVFQKMEAARQVAQDIDEDDTEAMFRN